jgi:hypothetical protein
VGRRLVGAPNISTEAVSVSLVRLSRISAKSVSLPQCFAKIEALIGEYAGRSN